MTNLQQALENVLPEASQAVSYWSKEVGFSHDRLTIEVIDTQELKAVSSSVLILGLERAMGSEKVKNKDILEHLDDYAKARDTDDGDLFSYDEAFLDLVVQYGLFDNLQYS